MGNYFLGVWLCLLVQQTQSYVYEVRVVRRTMPGTTSEKQYIVGLSDFHDRSQPRVATDQRLMLEKLLETSDAARMRFLVEDLSSPNCEGTCSCANYRVNTRGGFLGGITDTIKRYGCRVDNLEFRYCRVVALGLTATGKGGKQARALQDAIKLEQFIKETQSLLSAIGRYNDHGMATWYRSCMQAVETAMTKLNVRGCQNQTVREYLQAMSHNETTSKNKRHNDVLEELLSYDSPLFDARLVHEVLNDAYHKTVIVVAGGTHVREAFDALIKAGYEHVPIIQECLASSATATRNSVDVSNSQHKGSVLPRPIALTCSKRFWPQRNH